MTLKRLSLILFIIVFCIITYMMLMPSPPKIAGNFDFFDKIEHLAAFGALAFLFSVAVGRIRGRKIYTILLTAVLFIGYGILIEYIQQFTGRSAEMADVAADLAGIVLGGLLSIFFL